METMEINGKQWVLADSVEVKPSDILIVKMP